MEHIRKILRESITSRVDRLKERILYEVDKLIRDQGGLISPWTILPKLTDMFHADIVHEALRERFGKFPELENSKVLNFRIGMYFKEKRPYNCELKGERFSFEEIRTLPFLTPDTRKEVLKNRMEGDVRRMMDDAVSHILFVRLKNSDSIMSFKIKSNNPKLELTGARPFGTLGWLVEMWILINGDDASEVAYRKLTEKLIR